MHSSLATTILLMSLYNTITHGNPILPRDVSCTATEVNMMKCLSPTQFYICPTVGQAPIVQDVAAGTECRNNAILAAGSAPSSPAPAPPSPTPTPPAPSPEAKPSSNPPPPAAPKPSSTGLPPPPEGPKAPVSPFKPVPSGAYDPCSLGGVPTVKRFNCRTDIKDRNPTIAISQHITWCIDEGHYLICQDGPSTICSLKETMKRCTTRYMSLPWYEVQDDDWSNKHDWL